MGQLRGIFSCFAPVAEYFCQKFSELGHIRRFHCCYAPIMKKIGVFAMKYFLYALFDFFSAGECGLREKMGQLGRIIFHIPCGEESNRKRRRKVTGNGEEKKPEAKKKRGRKQTKALQEFQKLDNIELIEALEDAKHHVSGNDKNRNKNRNKKSNRKSTKEQEVYLWAK